MVRIESSGCYNGWPAANSWFIQFYWIIKSGCRSQTNIAVGNSSIWKVKRRSYLRYSRADSFSLSDSNNNKYSIEFISPVHRSVGEPAEGSLTRIQHVYPPPWSLVHSPPCSSRMNRKVRPYLEESHTWFSLLTIVAVAAGLSSLFDHLTMTIFTHFCELIFPSSFFVWKNKETDNLKQNTHYNS